MFMLELDSITKSYKRGFIPKPIHVLKGISLTVNRGEVCGYLGPNGAGKTTTLKIIMNFISPDSGKALINGIDVARPEARVSVGFLPEEPYYYHYLTGIEFLDYCGRLCGIPHPKRQERIVYFLERVSLTDAREKRLSEYSRGMLQRIGIAQALINSPELLILDEPLSGLDPEGRRDILDILLELKKSGTTILLSSHLLADAELLCDSISIINHGRIILSGKVRDVLVQESSSSKIEVTLSSSKNFDRQIIQNFNAIEVIPLSEQKYRIITNEKDINPLLGTLISAEIAIVSVIQKSLTLEELYLKTLSDDDTRN